MDDKWNAFLEGDRLFLHRSWTGRGIREAQFRVDGDSYRIESARVEGDHESYQRSGDDLESAVFEAAIEWTLLDLYDGPGAARWQQVRGGG